MVLSKIDELNYICIRKSKARSTVQKWVIHYAPQLEGVFRKRKKPVGKSWKMVETYIKVKGK